MCLQRHRAISVAFLFLLSVSYGRDDKTNGLDRLLFLRKPKQKQPPSKENQRAKRKGTNNTRRNTTHCIDNDHRHRWKNRIAIWSSKRKQKKLARKAYQMAILSSLAYHNFLDTSDSLLIEEGNNGTDSYNHRSWAFSLQDYPFKDHWSNSSSAVPWRKKKRRMKQLVSGVISRVHALLCHGQFKLAQSIPAKMKKRSTSHNHKTNAIAKKQHCKQKVEKKSETGKRFHVEWSLNNWHEENKAKIRWHDTDLIIATSGSSEIVLAFAGTASPADAVTNIQTLVNVMHSGFFEKAINSTNSTIEGNIHRGFLNAYSRVSRGKIRNLNNSPSGVASLKSLYEHHTKCIKQQRISHNYNTAEEASKNNDASKKEQRKVKKKEGKRKLNNDAICRSEDVMLRDMLLEVSINSLKSGHTVHLVGHSLAGSLATIHALDIVMNHAGIPIKRLHLWTYGAPEVADSLFFESAGAQSPQLRDFFSDENRFHRYVTQSTKTCATDSVASLTSKSLNKRALRRIGGVRGNVIHTIEPSFLMCNATGGELHELRSYLAGISMFETLTSDFPPHLKKWLGEPDVKANA